MDVVIAKICLPLILIIIVVALLLRSRKRGTQNQKGLWLILGGFSLFLLGSFAEVSEYASLDLASVRTFFDRFYARFCFLAGCLILLVGLIRRLPAVEILQETEGKLLNTQAELKREILNRQRLENELEKTQAALKALKEAKQEFLAWISHEMRTPLHGVLGMTELLMETKLDAHQLRMAQSINDSGYILLNLINENLDFSAMEAGKLQLEKSTFNLRHKIEELIDLMAERAQAKNLEFNFKLHPNLPVEVRGDPLRLYQILFNVLGNAIKYTEAGEIFLSGRLVEESEDKVTLHFAVRDTGLGISPEHHEKLFQPFYQVDSPESRKQEGSGLGLAIARELVERMHGEIGLESEPGKGSTFWFMIEMEKPLGAARLDTATDGNLEVLRAIVAENDHFHLQNLMRHLNGLGLQADQASSGREMLQVMRGAAQISKPYDVAFISMGLPDLNGQRLAKAIKSDWNLRKTKIVLLTSFADCKHLPPEPEAGIEAFLNKPVSGAKLNSMPGRSPELGSGQVSGCD
jgi:two-component system, sensor histidine kinase and response regulator